MDLLLLPEEVNLEKRTSVDSTVPEWALVVWPKIPQKGPRIYLPNLSAQAEKFWISMKKGFIGRS